MEETLRILIVDDDEVDRMAVRRALMQSDLSLVLTEATTYAQAITLLETNLFDCTFLDYGLPDQNGLSLVQTARRLNIQHPLVILTGQGDEKIAVDLMKAGATDYLAKSQISAITLAQILRNAIRIDRAERQILQSNQQLQQNNELLQQQNRDLEKQRTQIEMQALQQKDFIAHLTHDLRTPLVGSNLMFTLFQREAFGSLSSEMHAALNAMDRSNQNLLDLVNTLLEVHCYESGSKTLTLTTCNMWEIIQGVVDELQPLAQHKSIILKALSNLAHPELCKIQGDCQELRRMITNLVGNALKFTDCGSIELRLGFATAAVDETMAINGWVSIEVQDTGIGISAEEQAVIFERFRTGNHRRAGSGLGLHLVQRIVTTHAGTITVNSEMGKGSLFKVYLPAQKPLTGITNPANGLLKKVSNSTERQDDTSTRS
jgi:two-component system, sensor histidine kinase and response regulator